MRRGSGKVLLLDQVVGGDGTLSPEATARGRAWARTLRDRVVELLEAPAPAATLPWTPELRAYSDEAILEEARRRGLR